MLERIQRQVARHERMYRVPTLVQERNHVAQVRSRVHEDKRYTDFVERIVITTRRLALP
ncbi:hypothetical protein D3C87_2027620 [compost metagenome]